MAMFDFRKQITTEDEEVVERNDAFRRAQLTPDQQAQYAANRGWQIVGDGVRKATGGALGVDTRTQGEKNTDSLDEVKRQVAAMGIDPDNIDEFWKNVIQIYRQQGMIPEAMEAAKQYESAKAVREKNQISRDETARKTAKDAATKAFLDQKAKALMGGTLEGKLTAYQEILTKLDEPDLDDATKATLERMKTAAERSLGVKADAKPGVKLVAPNKYFPQGAKLTQQADGTWKQEPLQAGGGGAGGDGEGSEGPVDPKMSPAAKEKMAMLDALMQNINEAYNLLIANPEKVGPQAYLNNFGDLLDRFDTAGIPVRSRLANIASALVNARSGAAVTVQEFQRLRGFLPQPTDNAKAAIQKMYSLYADTANVANGKRVANGGAPFNYPPMEQFTLNYRKDGQAERKAAPKKGSAPAPTKKRRWNPETGSLE